MRTRCLAVLIAVSAWCGVNAAPPQDSGLEQAKRAFAKEMKEIDEEAEQERSKATDKLRKKYADVIARARRQNDQEAVDFFSKEALTLLGEDGTKGLDGFKKLRKGIMEVRIDGKPGVRSLPLSNGNRTHKFVVEIPRGAKSITLVTDPNKGEGHLDLAVWVEPYFYDR